MQFMEQWLAGRTKYNSRVSGVFVASTEDVCGLLQVSVQSLRRWRRIGCGPAPSHINNRHLFFSYSDIERWLTDRSAVKRIARRQYRWPRLALACFNASAGTLREFLSQCVTVDALDEIGRVEAVLGAIADLAKGKGDHVSKHERPACSHDEGSP